MIKRFKNPKDLDQKIRVVFFPGKISLQFLQNKKSNSKRRSAYFVPV